MKTYTLNEIKDILDTNPMSKHYLVELSYQNLDGTTTESEYLFISNKKDFPKIVRKWADSIRKYYADDNNTVCEAYLYAKGEHLDGMHIDSRRLFNKKFAWED